MQRVFALILTMALALQGAGKVPRPSTEFKIHELSGRDTLLSAQKGNVVVVQFLSTECSHCQETARWLSKVQTDLGSKGLRVYGVAFNPQVLTKDAAKNKKEMAKFGQHAKFPVGTSELTPILSYLGISVVNQKWGVPQIVVIDRQGMIRAQTPDTDAPELGTIYEPPVLLATITKLLNQK